MFRSSRVLAASLCLVLSTLLSPAAALAAAPPLTIVEAGPQGELARIGEAGEVRVLFSEPMVALGAQGTRPPWFRITPAVQGSLRWSGNRLLLFGPAPKFRFHYATEYTITVDRGAKALSGARLAEPYTFRFVTPRVTLDAVRWERKTRRADSPVVLFLDFNQPVSPAAVLSHLRLRYRAHAWQPPRYAEAMEKWLAQADPRALEGLRAKVKRVQEAAASQDGVAFELAKTWDTKRYPAAKNRVVLETKKVPPPQAEIAVFLDADARGEEGDRTPGAEQVKTVALEPAFFVDGLTCWEDCDPTEGVSVRFRGAAAPSGLSGKIDLLRVDAKGKRTPVTPARTPQTAPTGWGGERQATSEVTLERLGYAPAPASVYEMRVRADAQAADGQVLGYAWYGRFRYSRQSAFTDFGAGHGVWEASGGPKIPYNARNVTRVQQWVTAVSPENLVPTLLRLEGYELVAGNKLHRVEKPKTLPPGSPTVRVLHPTPDTVQGFGLDVSRVLGPKGRGLVWVALRGKESADGARLKEEARASLVQVTNLGISVKDSPKNTLVLVTSLDTGTPVGGADVELRTLDNRVFRKGKTDANGVVVLAGTDVDAVRPRLESRSPPRRAPVEGEDSEEDVESYEDYDYDGSYGLPHFAVIARKDGDAAYALSNWNEGLEPWEFDNVYGGDRDAKPSLRGTVFADRGVYKLGEEIHWKAIVRSDTLDGLRLLPAGTQAEAVLQDGEGKELDRRQVKLSAWGSADWTVRLPAEGSLGEYSLSLEVKGQRGAVGGSALVAAYRKPEFRVDVSVAPDRKDEVAGATLAGTVQARYLFGAPMAGREAKVTWSREPCDAVPEPVRQRYAPQGFRFLGESWISWERDRGTVSQHEETLDAAGVLRARVDTDVAAGRPISYTLEADVSDLSRQTIAGRASFVVHPAPWYVGVRPPPYFVDAKDGIDTEVVAVTPRGEPAAGVKVTVALKQVQWNSVRRAEGNGFYTWDTERLETVLWSTVVDTSARPVPVHVPVSAGGSFVLSATAGEPAGQHTTTEAHFCAAGAGYTAWERYDHNRIDLVADKDSYRPGDTAKILVKSPWEKATALLTTEREGVRTHREFHLTSTQQTLEVPVTEADIPNVFVSVLLVKGRTSSSLGKDGEDPGKPSFRLGYAALKVENGRKRLAVTVRTDREEYRPEDVARVTVEVADAAGKPVVGEVTLWAVDHGVLSLTGYKTPDPLDGMYPQKGLQVTTEDSRQRIISRRVIVPKGDEEGGGGGYDEGAENKARKDFRVLAFWIGSAVTDAKGRLTVEQKLPGALTTYRIMAVVHDKVHRFGSGEREIRLAKPLVLTPAFPRFLSAGDRALFGAVAVSQLPVGGKATVSMKSLDPSVLQVEGPETQAVELKPKSSAEVRFAVTAQGAGTGRLVMSVALQGEEDAFELAVPVRVPASPEVFADYGSVPPDAKPRLEVPATAAPDSGGLRVELSSTALVGLGEGARYLVDYPYGCAEQRSSAALALILAADLGGAFRLPGLKAEAMKEVAQKTLAELAAFQVDSGGFVTWKGGGYEEGSPYLTSWVLHVLRRATALGYAVPDTVRDRGYAYLEQSLGRSLDESSGGFSGELASEAFAVKVLAEGGRNADSHLTRLYGVRSRLPRYGVCFLRDALAARGEKGERAKELDRLLANAVFREAGFAHLEEPDDPYLAWYWSSNARSTAIALGTNLRAGADKELAGALVRWLMRARRQGRWGNTQENAWAMEALVDYYRKHEAEVPDFTAVVTLGLEVLGKEAFKGRSTAARALDVPLARLVPAPNAAPRELTVSREGTGTLHYSARLTYTDTRPSPEPVDRGIRVERVYSKRGSAEPATSYRAGDLVDVALTLRVPDERRFVAVNDPLPAGFEPVVSLFATTAGEFGEEERAREREGGGWWSWWERGGFDHVERHDDRVFLFATRLEAGEHTYRYTCRATTAGTFRAGAARAEQMYEPEVYGKTAPAAVEVSP